MNVEPGKDLKTILLIVEDEASIRMGLSAAMSRRGYRVITAENGRDAIYKAEENHPDLIISDVMMPVVDGFEMKKLLNANPALASIPLIYLTARTTLADRLTGIRGGGDDYIVKPFEVEELAARVEAVLRRTHAERIRRHKQPGEFGQDDLEKLRRELMQNFHHELRTPLNNVMMFLEIVATHKFDKPEDQQEFIRIARSSGERLESLVSDIILLTDLDQGVINTMRQPINPDIHILQPIQRRLARYEEKSLKFVPLFSLEHEIKAPRHEFARAVLHLVDNAFKFSPKDGTVILKINSMGNGGAIIIIEDTGNGIPVALREKVFERYYQISQGATRAYEGLGLGLAIARSVFRMAGGDVKILDSAKGCCVQATLPEPGDGDVTPHG
ncbi:MAG: hybrid sensor histidine kinase/response regulator [Chloroflexi bacterium]|nr:hybrid sensor histidine kinase/response regulator [Chloroflexota bacterium]